MGCTSSNLSYDCNESIYEASLQDRSKPCKRNFSKRVTVNAIETSEFESEVSVGASKFWSSTSGASCCSTPPNAASSAKKTTKVAKRRSLFAKLSASQMPKALAKLTLGDRWKADAVDSPICQLQRQQSDHGYFSASTDNVESSESSRDIDMSELSRNSMLICTHDIETTTSSSSSSSSNNNHNSMNTTSRTSNLTDSDLSEPVSNIKMEILMLRNNQRLMPKTSSPYCARRDTFACSGNASYTGTYRRWINCLEDTPSYTFKDITAIPEAIAGRFSPANHPAYTNMWNPECVSAAKRYRYEDQRYDEHAPANVPLAMVVLGTRIASPLVSTDL